MRKVDTETFVLDAVTGLHEDMHDTKSALEVGPIMRAAVERLQRRIPREDATKIVNCEVKAMREINMGLVTTSGTFFGGEKVTKEPMKAAPSMPECPLRKGSGAVRCRQACAFFDNGCILAIKGTGETLGRSCPLANGPCSESCALYNDGCSMLAVARMGRKECL